MIGINTSHSLAEEKEMILIKQPQKQNDPLFITIMPGLNINSVILNALPGSTIFLEPGKYYLNTITISNKINLTLRAVSGTVTIKMSAPAASYLKIQNSTNIQISGLFFEYDKMLAGISEDPLLQISHSEKINMDYTEISGNATSLVSVNQSQIIRLDHNLLWGICLFPIIFKDCSQVSMISNQIKTISDYPRFNDHILDSNFQKISGDQLITIDNIWSIILLED